MQNSKSYLGLILIFLFGFGNSGISIAKEKSEIEKAMEILEKQGGLEDPKDIMAWVNLPRKAKFGETINLVITIENGRKKKKLKLTGFDIWDEFLGGFEVLDIIPEPRHKDHSDGALTLEYPNDLIPGDVFEVTLVLKASKIGVFIGDVDVNEGKEFLSRMAQIRIEK